MCFSSPLSFQQIKQAKPPTTRHATNRFYLLRNLATLNIFLKKLHTACIPPAAGCCDWIYILNPQIIVGYTLYNCQVFIFLQQSQKAETAAAIPFFYIFGRNPSLFLLK